VCFPGGPNNSSQGGGRTKNCTPEIEKREAFQIILQSPGSRGRGAPEKKDIQLGGKKKTLQGKTKSAQSSFLKTPIGLGYKHG